MRPPFPGMDPWLEHADLWPDVHNRLIAAIADAMAPRVAPKYYIGLQERTYELVAGEMALWGVPDLTVVPAQGTPRGALATARSGAATANEQGVRDVDLAIPEKVRETYLEVRRVESGRLVTLLELLSPANKAQGPGRRQYIKKRKRVLLSRTNLVEIDLLRAGKPMLDLRSGPTGDYRILVSREPERPRAKLHYFSLRDPIPPIPLPLLPKDPEPEIELGAILHALYERARFDLRLDYTKPPVPPLDEADAAWARELTSRS